MAEKKGSGWVDLSKRRPHLWLDLGSGNADEGEVHPKGYVLNDIEFFKGIDLVCDIRDIKKFVEVGMCRRVRMSHVLEHFTIKEGEKIVRDIYDILEVGGEFLVIVPNFLWHARLALAGMEKDAILYAFGGQKDEYDVHKTGYTPKILSSLLTAAGYKIAKLDDGSCIECLAVRG